MSRQIKFDGFKKHERVKINPFVEDEQQVYRETDQKYDDPSMTDNDALKTKNVQRDLKKLEDQISVLCSTADEETSSGNGDNGTKHNFHMSQKYMAHQTQDCKQTFYDLASE